LPGFAGLGHLTINGIFFLLTHLYNTDILSFAAKSKKKAQDPLCKRVLSYRKKQKIIAYFILF